MNARLYAFALCLISCVALAFEPAGGVLAELTNKFGETIVVRKVEIPEAIHLSKEVVERGGVGAGTFYRFEYYRLGLLQHCYTHLTSDKLVAPKISWKDRNTCLIKEDEWLTITFSKADSTRIGWTISRQID